jgi:hypothetical protein
MRELRRSSPQVRHQALHRQRWAAGCMFAEVLDMLAELDAHRV